MSNLQTYYHFKLNFQKVDQHTGGKWLIHGTKRRKDNQLWWHIECCAGTNSNLCKPCSRNVVLQGVESLV